MIKSNQIVPFGHVHVREWIVGEEVQARSANKQLANIFSSSLSRH